MTTPQTVAGAIRARLIYVFPELQVFRNEAPEGTDTPVVIVTDGLNVQSEDLGDDLVLNEQVQVDLYIDYAQVTNWADQIHAALHRAPLSIPGSQIHRCAVVERINQPAEAGNEDGVERVTFTVLVRRRMSATEYGNLPIQPTPTLLEIHEAQTLNVHGIANTAELETQTGSQAKADAALFAANAYTDAAIEEVVGPDLSLYATLVEAQAKADAAEAAANLYTDDAIAAIPPVDLSSYETIVGAQDKADAAEAAAVVTANAYTDAEIAAIPPVDLSAYETIVGAQAKADAAEADAIAASNAYTDQEVIDLTNGTTDFESAQFNTTGGGTAGVGELTWNSTEGTLDLGLLGGNITLQVGEETVQHINNRTGSALTLGQAVYVSGSQGNRLTVDLALATNDTLSARTFGIVSEPIANNQSGFVTTSGIVHNMNTSAFPEGTAVYLSPTIPGGLTSTRPVAPYHGVLVGWCVRQHATIGMLFVHVQNGFELGELHNVLTNGTTNGQVLSYESATSLWKPVTLNYAPATGISPTAITGTAVITTDPRLSDSRTPTAHAASHTDGGSDEIAVAPAQIVQGGATVGQTLVWNGTSWAPATPAAGGSAEWLGNFPKSLPFEMLSTSTAAVGDIAIFTRAQSGGTISKIALMIANTPVATVSTVTLGAYQNVPGANFRLDLPGTRLTTVSGTPTASQTTPFLYELTLASPITIAAGDWFALYVASAGNKPVYYQFNNGASRALNITRYQVGTGGLPVTPNLNTTTTAFGTPAIIGIP